MPEPSAPAVPDSTEKPLVHAGNLRKSFGTHEVLKGINLDVFAGELVSIIGPSGCGKSTFLRCLNGLEQFNSGVVEINHVRITEPHVPAGKKDDQVARTHPLRAQVGMVFQQFNLFPHRTILHNVMMGPTVVLKTPHEEANRKARRMLEKVGLGPLCDRYPCELSGGQQQRAAIARALAMNPKVMLYDEPTSALDPTLVDEVLNVMRDLDAEGMTQIVVTHEMRFAKDASDYIVYMEEGHIIEISDEDEIFVNPKDERTRKFLRKFTTL